LKAFETDLLEQPVIVNHRPSPLAIVIRDVELVFARPPAPFHFFRTLAAFGLRSASSDA
jgi:hypothetical protein